ncbi:UDP-N-acetylmuramoyl-L-alanyl-D-glutamate--2,6-diaminopimelate ligase [Candidatus Microgenomates bacterium]|nr:UDP-N-acetylmuramoyl-L-alanyl-D-glutamate--2,6-diaminopimelate ligase [Candidatus Microgenomates bacterium]
MKKIKEFIRRFTPRFVFSWYYFAWSLAAALFYLNPSKNLLVVGVTGTNGKTSTVNAIHWILQSGGIRSGLISTANFKIGNKEWINKTKNTMLGRFGMQSMLSKMVKNGCRVAVLEVSSEGVASHRVFGINFDILVFTNLSPEHIESHGSFEKYKKAKQKIFASLGKSARKKIAFPATGLAKKTIIANTDDQHADSFLKFGADYKMGFSVKNKPSLFAEKVILASDVKQSQKELTFNISLGGEKAEIISPLLGEVNVYNLLAAAAVGHLAGFSWDSLAANLGDFLGVSGRMEKLSSKKGYDVIIDYALTPDSLRGLYATIRALYKGKIVAVFGACGGGRDKGKRAPMGQVVSGYADYSILTNEDPYFDDPYGIVREIANGFKDNDKKEGEDYEIIINREHAIEKALLMAHGDGDVVVITGKGSEVGMNVMGKIVPFNDREVVLKYLR